VARAITADTRQIHRRHYVKAMVELREYPDGRLAIFDGPRRLARYDAQGRLLDEATSNDR
jgi:hypothetical protein